MQKLNSTIVKLEKDNKVLNHQTNDFRRNGNDVYTFEAQLKNDNEILSIENK